MYREQYDTCVFVCSLLLSFFFAAAATGEKVAENQAAFAAQLVPCVLLEQPPVVGYLDNLANLGSDYSYDF